MSAMDLLAVLLLVVGIGVGVAIGLLVGRAKQAGLTAERDTLRADRDRLGQERAALESTLRAAQEERARLEADLAHEKAATAEKLEVLERSEQALRDSFMALSADALRRNNQQFLELAQERLKQTTTEAGGDLEKRQQAIENLVAPLKESLTKVETQLREVEQKRTDAYAELRVQVQHMGQTSEQLRVETQALVTALRAPQVRGRWGEMQLRRVVEAAGMVEHCDFLEQPTSTTEDGTLRPDLVVQLAGGKHIVVDSKVPFLGYLEAMEARDDATRAARLSAHARHLRDHIDALGGKAYWERFEPSPEFVVLFVPAEAFLNAALEEDPTLQERAFERNVVIATPQTLIALLRTVAYTWRQEALARNADDVLKLGRELYGRLATMGTHVDKLGSQLDSAVKSYNKTVASLEGRVLVTARKMADLQVSDAALDAPRQIEAVPRQVQAPELVASASEALVTLPAADNPGVPAEEATG
jgi:DNA recombination protein RmuC